MGRSLAWERPDHPSACTAKRVSGCSRSSPDHPCVPGAALEIRSALILSSSLKVCLKHCPALGQFPRRHRGDAILDLPECEQVNMLTHSTPKWHFLTHCKTREKASVLALSLPKLRYGLNGKCNLNPFRHGIRACGPSAELHRGRGRLDAAGTAPQSKENSEQIKTNHPMTGVKRNLLL